LACRVRRGVHRGFGVGVSIGCEGREGTGIVVCHDVGTATFSPPWQDNKTGTVKATVNLSGPMTGTSCGNLNGSPAPTAEHVTGTLSFKNGGCSTGKAYVTTKRKLTVTYLPAVAPSKLIFTAEQTFFGWSGTQGNLSGIGNVKGSYPITADNATLGGNGGALTGSCSTGISEMSWSAPANEQSGL
jgi:hypothetical protein